MSAEFEAAAEAVKKLKSPPSDDEKLTLYALYKIGKGEEVKQPGMFDFVGKAKYKAYQSEKDAGTSADDAQKKYIEEVEKLKAKYGSE